MIETYDEMIQRLFGQSKKPEQIGIPETNPYAYENPDFMMGNQPQWASNPQIIPPEEEEESLATLLGAQGGQSNQPKFTMNGMDAASQYQNMSGYSSVGNLVNALNGMKARTGQEQYQNFMPTQPQGLSSQFIQQLLQRGR